MINHADKIATKEKKASTMENSISAIAPLFMNLAASAIIHLNRILIYLSQKHRLIQLIRYFVVSAFLFLINLLPSAFSSINSLSSRDAPPTHNRRRVARQSHGENLPNPPAHGGGDSGVARALSQLLLLMNDVPVSSRKYEVVRSLAEKLIDENLTAFGDEGNKNAQALREVNCAVLSSAFARSLSQLEAAMLGHNNQSREIDTAHDSYENDSSGDSKKCNKNSAYGYYYFCNKVMSVVKGVSYIGRASIRHLIGSAGEGTNGLGGCSAEKMAAELLWLAEKMAASGCVEEAVGKWAKAGNLAWLSLTAEPRLQGSLVKVSAFLIRQAKNVGKDQTQDASSEDSSPSDNNMHRRQNQTRQTKTKMLVSWLPLLCRANNGTDSPILNMAERAEIEKTLEEIISCLDTEEEQEKVLSLWLHHFTYCPSSDWPNLRSCYVRWFGESRARLFLASSSSQ